jgi:outer membrane beta-barrel protein
MTMIHQRVDIPMIHFRSLRSSIWAFFCTIGISFALSAQSETTVDEDDIPPPIWAEEKTTAHDGASKLTEVNKNVVDENNAEAVEDVETVYAIQAKTRLHGGTFEISPLFLRTANNRFISQTGGMLAVLYHIRESIAIELNASVFGASDGDNGFIIGGIETGAANELRERENLTPEAVKLMTQTWAALANVQWTPVSAKFSLHDINLGTFELFFSVGAGVTGLQYRQSRTSDFAELPNPWAVAATFGGGLRFYFTDWLGLRIEVRDYVQPLSLRSDLVSDRGVEQSSFEVRNTLLAQVGLSFVIPTPWRTK